jgi:probable HAF family extracellular repeat protein
MLRDNVSFSFSRALHRLFHGASPNRRARRAMRRKRTPSRLTLECLESRELLSSYIVEDLGTLGGNFSEATAINAKGAVVGSARLPNGPSHAVLWDPGKPAQDLGTLGGSESKAFAINILGEIVGEADTTSALHHPFVLQPGGSMSDLTNVSADVVHSPCSLP